MWKHAWSVAAIALCLHCGGGTPAESPDEAPVEESEATPETPAMPAEEGGEGAASADTETPSEEPAEKTGGKSGGKKVCSELKKSDCQVTQGCAWNDLKKCVEEGASE